MGIVSKETGVLKLVRAGGIVELYKHPVKASQIMERYPRHCVTRPDFFRYPCIVVKPESVLKPGKVFFIVPYHTIYRLLKSKGYRCNCTHYTPARNEPMINPQSVENVNRRSENIDASFFHQIMPAESVRSKKKCGQEVAGGEDGCLKPCLKTNRADKSRFQRGPRVRFMLPDEDDDDDYYDMSFVLP